MFRNAVAIPFFAFNHRAVVFFCRLRRVRPSFGRGENNNTSWKLVSFMINEREAPCVRVDWNVKDEPSDLEMSRIVRKKVADLRTPVTSILSLGQHTRYSSEDETFPRSISNASLRSASKQILLNSRRGSLSFSMQISFGAFIQKFQDAAEVSRNWTQSRCFPSARGSRKC